MSKKINIMFLDDVKFIYSEKATKFCKISTLLLSIVHTDKCKVEISQNFVAFSEYVNFNMYLLYISRIRVPGICFSEKIGPNDRQPILAESTVPYRSNFSIKLTDSIYSDLSTE